MPRYIDEGKVREVLFKTYFHFSERLEIVNMLKEVPTADVVPVVRCKDCVSWDSEYLSYCPTRHYCGEVGLYTEPDFFCKWGERREDAEIYHG